ncbi:hypothetical protein [Lignipirellula cremea]|uniref:hypothetical protein n=1 Tax=Lignipirellula cremea TaxID=2528010 RepID=UPI0018D20F70|nr:hypothetical protein [Lignipirellula cremea]
MLNRKRADGQTSACREILFAAAFSDRFGHVSLADTGKGAMITPDWVAMIVPIARIR